MTPIEQQSLPAWKKTLLLIGSFGPLGHLPASGTVTVILVGVPIFYLTRTLPPDVYLFSVAIFSLLAVGLHHLGDQWLEKKDSRNLVWDEIAGYLVAITFLPFTWKAAVASVLVERFFDITKIYPANWIEKKIPGGWGVVGDDLVAGAYTFLILRIVLWIFPNVLA